MYEGSFINTATEVSSDSSQKFKISNSGVDTNTINIKVFESSSSTIFTEFKPADNILDIGADDSVYFINESEDEDYEVFFGDGILGKALVPGQVVQMSYIITNGPTTNGAKTFTFNGLMEDENGISITVPFSVSNISTSSIASGGADIESIDKIKYNAPKLYG